MAAGPENIEWTIEEWEAYDTNNVNSNYRKVFLPIDVDHNLIIIEERSGENRTTKVHLARLFRYIFGQERGDELFVVTQKHFLLIDTSKWAGSRQFTADLSMLEDSVYDNITRPRFVDIPSDILLCKRKFTEEDERLIKIFLRKEHSPLSIFENYAFQFATDQLVDQFNNAIAEVRKHGAMITHIHSAAIGLDLQIKSKQLDSKIKRPRWT